METRIMRFSPIIASAFLAVLTACSERPTAPKAVVLAPPQSQPQTLAIMPGVPTTILTPATRPANAAPAASGAVIEASTGPVTFRRTPAEGGGWTDMPVGGDAYFRDVAWEAAYTLDATADGDHWESNITFPSGGSAQFPAVLYRSTFNGESDCWFLGGALAFCGTTSVSAEDMLSIQCGNHGTYVYRLYENGGLVFTGGFVLKSTLPPGSFQNAFQTAFPDDQYDNLCYVSGSSGATHGCVPGGSETQVSIKAKGCALTGASMVLGYWGGSDDPSTLNDFLNGLPNDRGYTKNGNINWDGILDRAAAGPTKLNFRKTKPGTVSHADLRNRICRFGPQLVEVRNKNGGTHFVMVTGLNNDETDFTISDPSSPDRTLLGPAYGDYVSVREFEPTSQLTWDAVLNATAYSPVELVITDPLGRRTGYDPLQGVDYTEIPSSVYDSTGLGTLIDTSTSLQIDPLWKEVEVRPPMDGDYTLSVTGTASGTYTLQILGYDQQHRNSSFVAADVPINQGEVHEYTVHFSSTDMSAGVLPMAGGFNGGGQRAAVNMLLSYARPTQGHTALAAGTTTYPLMIFYDGAIDPATFVADLGGLDVGTLFHPVPGTNEVVNIPLQSGRNVLKLGVTGSPGGRSGTDHDQLTFLVP